jgi:hypothetical protein
MADDLHQEAWEAHTEALELLEVLGVKLDSLRRVLGLEELGLADIARRVSGDEEWEAFVAGHPELTDPPAFTDREVLNALPRAIREQNRRVMRPRPFTWSSSVAHVLAPDLRGKVRQRHVCRVAQALRRLADAGKVTRLYPRPPNHGHSALAWGPAGLSVSDLDDSAKSDYVLDTGEHDDA